MWDNFHVIKKWRSSHPSHVVADEYSNIGQYTISEQEFHRYKRKLTEILRQMNNIEIEMGWYGEYDG